MNPLEHTHDKNEIKILEDIHMFGRAVIVISETDYLPSFGYTAGLWKNHQHPELICFGLSVSDLHTVLNTGADLVQRGYVFNPGKDYDDFIAGGMAQFIPVDQRNLNDYFGYAIWFNGGIAFPALQLVWTDHNGNLPWDPHFHEALIYHQPLLDRNADFKFREDRRLAVFTTRQWLKEGKPILQVIHEENGDWQFLTGDQKAGDIKIVALEEMIAQDPTLNEVFNLDFGEAAERRFVGDGWIRNVV